jgi:hypothetical protein
VKPEQRNLIDIQKYIQNELIPEMFGVSDTVSTETVQYLIEWGYKYKKNTKDIYFDGHENQENVKYRKGFCKRLLDLLPYVDYLEDNEDQTQKSPKDRLSPGTKKHVILTHDKSTFYAHDGKIEMWLKENEKALRINLHIAQKSSPITRRRGNIFISLCTF